MKHATVILSVSIHIYVFRLFSLCIHTFPQILVYIFCLNLVNTDIRMFSYVVIKGFLKLNPNSFSCILTGLYHCPPQEFVAKGSPKYIMEDFAKRTGVKGDAELSKLPYWDMVKNHLIDYMHCGKNVFERITRSLMAEDWEFKPGVRGYMTKLGMRVPESVADMEVMYTVSVLNCLFSAGFAVFHCVSVSICVFPYLVSSSNLFITNLVRFVAHVGYGIWLG
jgi:hypothetical protein